MKALSGRVTTGFYSEVIAGFLALLLLTFLMARADSQLTKHETVENLWEEMATE